MESIMTEAGRNPLDFLFKIEFPAYYQILIRQRMFIIVFCLSATLFSLALTYVFSEKYLAGTNVYYRPLENSIIREKGIRAFGAPVPIPPFKVIIQTLRDIAKSEPILRPIVKEFGLDKSIDVDYPTWYEQWYHGTKKCAREYTLKLWMLLKYGRVIEEKGDVPAILKLRKNIDIASTKDSYIYILSCKDKYPERAARIVDALALHLVKWLKNQDIGQATRRLQLVREQAEEKEHYLIKLRDEMNGLLEENNAVSVKEEISIGVQSFYDMDMKLVQLTSQIENKQEIIAELAREIKGKYIGFINPDDLKRMESNKLFETIELKGLIAEKSSVKSSLDSLHIRLQQLRSLGKTIDGVIMKIEGIKREYVHLKDLDVEALIKSTTKESVIKIMHRAETPQKPVQPIKVYHVGLTAILALFVSTGLVYVLAFFNIRTFFSSDGLKRRRKVI